MTRETSKLRSSLRNKLSRVFERADPFAVSRYVNQHIGSHNIRLPAGGSPEATLYHRKFSNLDLCRISYGGIVRITSPSLETIYHLQILLSGHCLWRTKKQEQYLSPGELLLINPDEPVDLTYSIDCEKFIMKIPATLLETICDEKRWHRPSVGVRFMQNNYRLDELECFDNLLALVCQEAESSDPLPRVQEHYAQIVGRKLLSLLKTNVNRETRSQDASFERILNYIEKNLKQDINSELLAQQSNVSERSLYTMFERNLGSTPKNYIRKKKLDRIRASLDDPSCNVRSVTELAMDYGFIHLGRFSENYKSQFNELPSETMKRRTGSDNTAVQPGKHLTKK